MDKPSEQNEQNTTRPTRYVQGMAIGCRSVSNAPYGMPAFASASAALATSHAQWVLGDEMFPFSNQAADGVWYLDSASTRMTELRPPDTRASARCRIPGQRRQG